ncbi:cob(I)yrinic acid a,c-diamide adenosyltransferase [Fusobacterium sp.]|uniref:cob(I)yrinic acid a,c-diamide adenosyltransferase n=1 Tax=Fusobacterium sp. TaxID=68766 RepID=UPI0025C2BC6C|nr:cob(I)yrinic acid a,c-diamide adenosyltransferase [Fusobacterium sp.]MCI7222829.1 cob(I)yrinic acid a,c-diamide adenosyltransferase [Fusobacterium sp.]
MDYSKKESNKDHYINLGKIYTKRGDTGETSLLNGQSVKKSSIQVEAYGIIDEANAVMGFAKSLVEDEEIKTILTHVQEKFILVGAYLSAGADYDTCVKEKITKQDVEYLEKHIDEYNKRLLPLYKFVIPGDETSSASLHIARTVVRRVERAIVKLSESIKFPAEILKYINRTSDLLFVLSRIEDDNRTINYIKSRLSEALRVGGTDKKIYSFQNLTLENAKRIVTAGELKAKELKKDFVFTVVNAEGNLILQEKMDNAILISVEVSRKKAYTSASLRAATADMAEMIKPGRSLYTLQNDPKYVMFGGGIPLFKNEILVGAIGVSGGSVEEDLAVARECEKEFKKILEGK